MSEVTMGSSRKQKTVKLGATVDKAVENNAPLAEETGAPESNRQSSAESAPVVKERAPTTRRLGGNRPAVGAWYLQDTEDLAGVTAEGFNDELGIREIKVYDPSDAQWNNGVLAITTLETVIGQIKGVQVMESSRDNSIYLRMQSRSWEGNDGKKNYVNDLTLDRKVTAQVLRYVDAMLEDATVAE